MKTTIIIAVLVIALIALVIFIELPWTGNIHIIF